MRRKGMLPLSSPLREMTVEEHDRLERDDDLGEKFCCARVGRAGRGCIPHPTGQARRRATAIDQPRVPARWAIKSRRPVAEQTAGVRG